MQNFKMNLDILQVVEHYLPLQKSGVNFVACCPFHSEKSPSFYVNPQKQIYHCFGCQASGDAINFVQEFRKVDFKEAVQELCDLFALQNPLSSANKQAASRYAIFQNKLKELSDVFFNNLKTFEKLQDYLKGRGFNLDDCQRFSIGYCKGDEILSIFTRQQAIEIGLLTEKGWCPFSNRMVITLYNKSYKPIGFVGRTHPYFNFNKSAKYVNSKESFLYKKSENLYNLARAKSRIQSSKKCLIVEGYMDALSAMKLNIPYCVATGGTAFNKRFLAQVANLDCKLYFLFDSDSSGQAANLRAIRVCFESSIYDCKVFIIKGEFKDLGEILEYATKNNLDSESTAKLLDFHKFGAIEFFIKASFKACKTPKDRDNLVLELKNMVKNEKNFYQKQFLIDEITKHTGIDRSYFMSEKVAVRAQNYDVQRFLTHLVANDDNFYIAKNTLMIEALPKDFREAVQSYLNTNELGELQKYTILNADEDFDFARAVLGLNINHLENLLTQAKAKKDLEHIISLNAKISEFKASLNAGF